MITIQNLRSFSSGAEPDSLLAGQICFNVVDKIVYVGDGSAYKTSFDGTIVAGTPGGGWYSMPMDFSGLTDFFVQSPQYYGDLPTDNQVLTWSTALNHPIWTSGGSGGGGQVYEVTNNQVALAPGLTVSDKIINATGVVSPDEGDTTIVTGQPGEVYQGLYIWTTEWVRVASYANPTAAQVTYDNSSSGLPAITVQQACDELNSDVIAATSIANTANATALAAQALASAALPKAGGTMTGNIVFNAGQTFPVSGIQIASASQLGVVQGSLEVLISPSGVMTVRPATIGQSGIVQLVDNTSSTSITEALTANQGKNLQDQINNLNLAGNVTLAGTLNAATGNLDSVTADGASAVPPFVSGAPLPSPSAGNTDYYVIVTVPGNYNPPGGGGPHNATNGDWFLSNGTSWQFLGVGDRPAYASTSAAGVVQLATNADTQAGLNAILAVTPVSLQSKVSDVTNLTSSTTIASSTAVKSAYDLAAAALPRAGGTMTGLITFAAGQTFPITGIQDATTGQKGVVQIGANIQVSSGTISVNSASTTVSGVVQLNDTTTSTSATQALTANQGKVLQDQINALIISNNLTFAGTIDGSTGLVLTVSTEGAGAGFFVGAALPAPASTNDEYFTIVTVPGTMTPPGGVAQAVNDGDWWLSDGTVWQYLNVGFSAPYATTTSSGVIQLATDAEVQAGVETTHAVVPSSLQSKLSDSVATTSSTTIASSTAVKTAYDLAADAIPCSSFANPGELLAGTGAGTYAALSVGTNGQVLIANSACTEGVEWGNACYVPDACFTAAGQLIVGTGVSTYSALSIGTTGQILTVVGGLPAWAAPPANLCGFTCTAAPLNTALGATAGDSITSGASNTLVGYAAGTGITSGTNNTFIGTCSGDLLTNGNFNTALGSAALGAQTGGDNNTAIGQSAGTSVTTGQDNTFVGQSAGSNVTTASGITAVGYLAGRNAAAGTTAVGCRSLQIATGANNTAVGWCTGACLTSGTNNTAVGYGALDSATIGSDNVAVGNGALCAVTTGTTNTVIGSGAGVGISTQDGHVAIGTQTLVGALDINNLNLVAIGTCALRAVTTGQNNIGIGFCAGALITTGGCNIAIGARALDSVTSSANNIGIGFNALTSITTGSENLAIGTFAGDAITTGADNVAIGYNAGTAQAAGAQSVFIGTGAGQTSDATGITAIGFCAAQANTTAGCGTYLGYVSGRNATGLSNTYVGALTGCAASNASACGTLLGFCAGAALTSGNANTFIGFNAGRSTTTGTFNVALGAAAFQSGTGSCNIAVGCGALSAAVTGTANVAIGHRAMLNSTSAANNVAIGLESGVQLSTGSNNTFVGHLTGDTVTTGIQNTFLGACSGGAVATNSEGNTAVGFGAGGIGTLGGGYNTVLGHSAGQAITAGGGNTFVGYQSGASVTTGIHNTFLGRYLGTAAMSNNVVLADGAGTVRFQANSSGAWSPDGTNFGTTGQILASGGTGAVPTWTWSLPQVPVPPSSASGGVQGQVSSDANYFYFYTGGRWQRIAWDATVW